MKSQTGLPSVEIVSDKTVMDLVNEIAVEGLEEPFYTVDLGDIVYKYKLWKLNMSRIHPFYAVKCNDSPLILELLAALGTGFDCASKAEIEAVLSMGVDPSRIIYANPCKTGSFIKHAASVGVNAMTFDNEMELHKTKSLHPDAQMVLRIRVDDSSSICRLGIKFGCNVDDASHLLQVAKQLGINVIGVSFHVGSGCLDANAYYKAIELANHVFMIGKRIGFTFTLLDIGGGFPGSRGPYASFEEIAAVVNKALDIYFPVDSGIKIIAEPGRFFVASAFTLITNIIAKREVMIPNEGELEERTFMYYLSDGVYGSFNCLIFDHAEVTPYPLADKRDKPVFRTSLWGPTCDSMDRIVEVCYMPDMKIGEWIVFENMGAYTICAASNFNGFEKPALKFYLPQHALIFLQQLTSWSRLMTTFSPNKPGMSEISDQASNGSEGMHLLPVAEAVFA